ncbi:MAG TPA: hypothetical protein ENN36_10325 [Candidatus Bathyarchaeota archaeon]|nr:hypothetical protein [Candidatus Bathyarchaeota archaeon]
MTKSKGAAAVQYRPLTLFWIVEFSDGSALAQFDPDSGVEVRAHPDWLPSKVDENGMIVKDGRKVPIREAYPIPEHFEGKQVVRIGWYPFSMKLAANVFRATGQLATPSNARPVFVEVEKNDMPVCYRSHEIKLHMRSGGVEYAETVYVLGIEGKRILHINENGEVIG